MGFFPDEAANTMSSKTDYIRCYLRLWWSSAWSPVFCLVHILDNVKNCTSLQVVLLRLVIIYLSVSNILAADFFCAFIIDLCGRKAIGCHLDVFFQRNFPRAFSELKLPLKMMLPILVFLIFYPQIKLWLFLNMKFDLPSSYKIYWSWLLRLLTLRYVISLW